MNEQGSKCPNCRSDIGLWPVIKAPLPNMMRCPHCNTKIKYEKTGWKIPLLCAISYLVIIYLVLSSATFLDAISFLKMAIIVMTSCVILWQPFEFALALYLRKNQKLIINKTANN